MAQEKAFLAAAAKLLYREKKGFYLPKFNAGKIRSRPKPAEPAPAAAPEVKKVSAAAPRPKRKKFPCAAQPAVPTRATNWTDKLNPFRAPTPTAPCAANAVQVELSLEAVKVVHNDLADADIEVVPGKSRRRRRRKPPILPPSRSAWEFLGERL